MSHSRSDAGAVLQSPDSQESPAAECTRSSLHQDEKPGGPDRDRMEQLRHIIEHAGHLLPTQGPITVFVHHNTLHALEDLPFEHALERGSRLYRCHTYLLEKTYRQELERGRIRREDLAAVLIEDLGDDAEQMLGLLGTRFHLRLGMLEHPLRIAPDSELRWVIAETDALRRFRAEVSAPLKAHVVAETRHWVMRDLRNGTSLRSTASDRRIRAALDRLLEHFGRRNIEHWSDATWEAFCLNLLWQICHQGVHGLPEFVEPSPPSTRPRDWLLEATGMDADRLVHDLLIRFCSAFLDQGIATWPLPHRDAGFFRAFSTLYRSAAASSERWLRGLKSELQRLERDHMDPLASIADSLELLGIDGPHVEAFLAETLLALRGWAGMLLQMETNAEWTIHPAPRGSFVEFLAVRLLLDRLALAHVAKEALGYHGPLAGLRKEVRRRVPRHHATSVDQRTFLVFQLAQVRGWKPEDLFRLTKPQWTALVREIESFSALERRRIFHLAYERRYRNQTLDALVALNAGQSLAAGRSSQPAAQERRSPLFQVVCCLDEREESFRRHLEELAPECETFGAAGFFGVAMYYRGAADAHFVPLCPVVIKPRHFVQEDVAYTFEEAHRRRAKTRRWIGTASHWFHTGSRSFLAGALMSLLGSLASFPLVARTVFPRTVARLRGLIGRMVQPPRLTQLRLERSAAEPGCGPDQLGFTVEEMANIVERVLRDIGLTRGFSELVVIVGHGSSSLNNPHEAAHDCGACGGGRGGPNARAFAHMANDVRVRALLGARGLAIPPCVCFVGAYHNTCDDSITYYDLDRLPVSQRGTFEHVTRRFDAAREWNAHERCRRFESAPLSLSPQAALRHVEVRAEDLSQTRPEYGHATNAVCIVGRRARTRGLFLDRRAFLASYDPTQDDAEHTILTRILQAVVPVCAGINLEYYFSFVDPTGWGCGTKLPHNIASLLGVMDGAASDLRPGLPWQMVEIHEPVRLLMVVESTPAALAGILERNPAIAKLCHNRWLQLAALDPHSPAVHVLENGSFQPYRAETSQLPEVRASVEWYRGWRDHLGYAAVLAKHDLGEGALPANGVPER